MTPSRILIVNPFGIGDVLFSTPLIRAVRRAFPDAHLAYLCNRRTEQMLRWNQHLNELFIYEKDELLSLWNQRRWLGVRSLVDLLRTIKSRRFELAIDLSLGERYGFVLAVLGIPRRIGFDYRSRGRFLTQRFPMDGYQDRHVIEYYEQLLAMLGIRMQDRHMELATDDTDRHVVDRMLSQLLGARTAGPLVGLVPAGGISWGMQANYRRWAKEGFIHVGQALQQRYGVTILVFGERNDQPACREIAQAIGHPAIDLSGRTSLGQFVQFVSRCAVVIANDGGPIHIAASQGVRTVSIFGPVDPRVYGPYPADSRHQIVYRDDLPCRPCYHRFRLPPCPYERGCLSSLEPAQVLQACERALQDAIIAPVPVHA